MSSDSDWRLELWMIAWNKIDSQKYKVKELSGSKGVIMLITFSYLNYWNYICGIIHLVEKKRIRDVTKSTSSQKEEQSKQHIAKKVHGCKNIIGKNNSIIDIEIKDNNNKLRLQNCP